MMFERILVAVDGSREGGKTVPVAIDLATRYGSEVTVVHVREHGRYEGADVDLGPGAAAEDIVNAVHDAFAAAGIDARTEIRRVSPGDTPEQIVGVAQEVHADLIVMGAKGLDAVSRFLLGSVSTRVVQYANCSVLVVR